MKSDDGLPSSARESIELFLKGKGVQQIAEMRSMSRGTIAQHLAMGIASGKLQADPRSFYTADEEALIRQAAEEHGHERLGPLHEALGGAITYDKLHAFRAFMQRNS